MTNGAEAMHELTSRFVSAYNRIQKRLENIVGCKDYIPFAELVEKAAGKNSAVKQFKKRLKSVGNLRNLLVHDHEHHKEVAVPTERTVRGLEALAETITSPPPLLSVASRSVHSCRPGDPVGAAAQVMHDNSFSQLPVHDGEKLVGLLTGETIARWLAARLEGGVGILEEEPVDKVLEHQEAAGYILVGKTATVFDALKEFDRSLRSGTSLQAIIVTANGKSTETPLGIVTPADIPSMLRAAEP
jgi:predicted transcriptional regulator